MDNIFVYARQIRASEQRSEMSFRLIEVLDAAGRAHRLASGARMRLKLSDIPMDSRDWIADDIAAARQSLNLALAALDEVEAMCRPAPVMLEAAE